MASRAAAHRRPPSARRAGRPAPCGCSRCPRRFPPTRCAPSTRSGQRAFGENYVQEGVAKRARLRDLPDVEWHLIGPLQSNKTAQAAAAFDWVESVDRLKIAQRLSAQRPDALPPLDVCVQVNVSGEASKSGVAPAEALALAQAIAALPRLALRGIMGIPAPTADVGAQRRAVSRAARVLRRAARGRACRRHAVDGHVGGPRGGDRRRVDAGARGHRDLRARG